MILRRKCRWAYHTALFYSLLLITGIQTLRAQSPYDFCRPELIHYSPKTYGGYNQNWGVVQNRRTRFLYFANSKGLMEFDGSRWNVYELPRRQRVRSVAIDEQGRIYTGALGEFGYWFPNERGELTYHSLVDRIEEKAFQTEEIWNILVTPNGILFQSFAFLYRYQSGKVQRLTPPGNIHFVRSVRNRLMLQVLDKGLYEIQGDRFVLLPGSEFTGSETVNTLLPIGESDILVGTERAVYRYDGITFRPFDATINAFMQHNRLNRAIRLGPDLYAFGTLLNGVLITTASGEIRSHFNQKSGLQNSTVLSLYQDADSNVWVGLDKGIDLINVNSPVRYFTDNEGNMGTVYDMIAHSDNLYLGTNQGVYYKSLADKAGQFQLVQGTQGQVWQLAVMDNQLLCGHNRGTFWIEGTQANIVSTVTGGWVVKRLKHHPDKLIQGTYTNLCIYQKDKAGNWAFSHKIDGFSAPVRQLEEDNEGTIWVNKANNQGVQRLQLSADLRRVTVSTEYADSAFHSPVLDLSQVQHQIVVNSARGVWAYESTREAFVPASTMFSWAKNTIQKIVTTPDSGLFLLRQDGTVSWVESPNGTVFDIPVNANQGEEGYGNIVLLDSSTVAFCRENGFALLPFAELKRRPTLVPSPVIRLVSPADYPAEAQQFWERGVGEQLSFAHNQSGILITFSTPYYTQPIRYSYWLENSTKYWSSYAAIQQKEFSNLPPGDYVFHLKSDLSATESTVSFEIRAPWYWNTGTQLLYLLLFGYLCWFFYQLHLRRVAEHQHQIREKLEEKLRHQEEESQREIILLQKEQLEQGLIQKSEELANSTMSLIQKNELLIQLKDELNRLKTRSASRLQGDDFGRINTLIDTNISSDKDWKLFEANFNKVHEQFLKHLIANYPDLGQGDLKLAAYLRMNLSTKEIAHLLNITHRSVELKRYRLRKKLNLDADTNLGEFMIKY